MCPNLEIFSLSVCGCQSFTKLHFLRLDFPLCSAFDTGLADVPAEFGFIHLFLTYLQECEGNNLLCFTLLMFHLESCKIGLNY